MRLFFLALLVYCAIALSLTAAALVGLGSITPEGFIDGDALYGHPKERAKLRPFDDPTAIVLELGRDRAVASGLQQGRLDTWNPRSAGGAPLWAEQGGPFFPTKFIYYLYPHQITLMAALAARLVVAGLGMFFLARAFGMSFPVALFTGALFEYSGILSATLAYSSTSAAYVLPWALLGAHKLWAERGPAAVAVSGLALGVAWLGGSPSFALIVYLGFAAWLVGECLSRRPPLHEIMRVTALVVAAGLVALLIAAVGMLPFLELLSHGHSYKYTHAAEIVWVERLGWTRDVFAMAMFFPSLISAMRDTMPANYWPFAGGASIGFVALLLAIVGAQKLREHWGLVIMAVLGIGLTLSPPGLQWLHQLPGLRVILPWYCYPLIIVPLCIAAGYGLRMIGTTPRKNLLLVPLGIVLSGAVLLGLMLVAIVLLGGLDALLNLKKEVLSSGLYRKAPKLVISHMGDWKTYVSPAAAVVAVTAYVLLWRNNLTRAFAVVAVVALIEAAAIRMPIVIFERAVVLRSGPSEATTRLQALLSGGSWRFIGVPTLDVGAPNTSLLFELSDFRSCSALTVRRLTKYLDYAGTETRTTWHAPQTISIPMLSLAAVRYVVYAKRHRTTAEIPSSLREMDTVGEVVFFENPHALPRFRIAHDVIPVGGEQQAFETLQRLFEHSLPVASPEWARWSVIEGIGTDEALRVLREPGPQRNPESIRLVSEPDPQMIVLEATLDTPGYVVVADTFYPGWTATVDGAPASVYPANLLFRAVFVPEGRHTIVMEYESTWLRTGGVLTLLGLFLTGALFVVGRHQSRR